MRESHHVAARKPPPVPTRPPTACPTVATQTLTQTRLHISNAKRIRKLFRFRRCPRPPSESALKGGCTGPVEFVWGEMCARFVREGEMRVRFVRGGEMRVRFVRGGEMRVRFVRGGEMRVRFVRGGEGSDGGGGCTREYAPSPIASPHSKSRALGFSPTSPPVYSRDMGRGNSREGGGAKNSRKCF